MEPIFIRQVSTLVADITTLKFLSLTPKDGQKFILDPKGFVCTKLNHSYAWTLSKKEVLEQYDIVDFTEDGWLVAQLKLNPKE